ncbi:hypothetical protein BDM02DRAFT_3087805 [Thelephora ganbajun]|uniref:Uncharacterized protein n=1 Tax=Thelephora ganbajun TaxID=370292 RepID=A0ACB6ZUC6_THEGA|nr:hypothetical protein BDM02DRAFT_3087805 [Thelephora ganbajun]
MLTDRAERWDKLDLKPKRWWGYTILLFILGTLLPPLAVAARFGIGKDFWINVVLTLCGYIPGHGHNFYIQNIRNNKSNRRTPKWAQKYGLVDMTALERRRKRAQWANRYNERVPRSTWEGAEYAEGQEPGGSSVDLSNDHANNNARSGANGDLWRPEDEQYYTKNEDSKSQGRWHYPANFDDVAPDTNSSRKKSKKDRWARTEDAYVREAEASERRKRKKSKKNRSTVGDSETYSRASGSTTEFPEDAEGGLYGDRANTNRPQSAIQDRTRGEDPFNHEF